MGRSHSINEAMNAAADADATPGGAIAEERREERYSGPAIFLHWLMAALLVGMIGVGLYMVELPKRTPEVAYYYNLHKSFGLVALLLLVVRAVWRWRTPPPSSSGLHRTNWQSKAAQISHRLLYACMLLMPLSGFAGSSFGKYPVKFFGYALPRIGSENAALQAFFRQAHEMMAWLLCALIALHLVGVLFHLATSGKGILRRMSPRF